jgi:hypothetical protein
MELENDRHWFHGLPVLRLDQMSVNALSEPDASIPPTKLIRWGLLFVAKFQKRHCSK